MVRKKKLWYHPEKVTGWRKTQPAKTRRRKIYASTDKRKSRHDRDVEAARTIGGLCNVTKGRIARLRARKKPVKPVYLEIEKKACADAQYFYKKAKQTA